MLRFVISERDPGVANWLEFTGRRRGYVQVRWQRLTRDLAEEDGPRRVGGPVRWIAGRLAYRGHARCRRRNGGTGSPRGRPPSQKGCWLMMLRDKVVVVAGVGSGLAARRAGRRQGRRGRGAGRAHGGAARRRGQRSPDSAGRGLAVPTDLADAAAANTWPRRRWTGSAGSTRWSTTRWRCRRSRPSARSAWKPSAPASTATWSPPAADQAAHAGARGEPRRGGDDRLDGGALLPALGRTSSPRRPCWRWRRAWPPSSGRADPGQLGGARAHLGRLAEVVLRLPGAQARGGDPGDLRRDRGGHRPAPAARAGRVADAVVFLASPLARAITGQCLDVNCGGYHH